MKDKTGKTMLHESMESQQQPARATHGRLSLLSKLTGVALLACVAPFAHAQSAPAYTNAPAIIRAGPSQDYPAVAQLQGGTPMTVLGCVEGYSWCDVTLPGLRGWVYGGSINYAYQGQPVPLMTYGPQIGLPIIGFSFGSYWGDHYRAEPWYGDRGRWEHIAPPRPEWRGGPPPGRGEWRGGPPEGPRPEWHGGPPPGPRPEFRGGPPQPHNEEFRGGPQPHHEEFHGGPPQGPRPEPHGGPGPRQEFHGGPAPAPHPEPHGGPPPGGGGHPEGPRGGGEGDHRGPPHG